MMMLRPASVDDLEIISSIANRTWPATYGNILSADQLNYMLALFYSAEALTANIKNGHQFLLALEDGIAYGFLGLEHNHNQKNNTHIHKIYVLPDAQGKGLGRMLVQEAVAIAKSCGSIAVTLNVNRSNPARCFYEKLGFIVKYSIDIELEHGYLMEDFMMEKPLVDF